MRFSQECSKVCHIFFFLDLKPWWCCQWCVWIIFVESQALRVGSAQCCFSTFVIRLLISKYIFGESSF